MSDLVKRLRHADEHSLQRIAGSDIFKEAAERIAKLEVTLCKAEQFIVNGVELGYIRMPDKGDPALDTLPAIRQALGRGE